MTGAPEPVYFVALWRRKPQILPFLDFGILCCR